MLHLDLIYSQTIVKSKFTPPLLLVCLLLLFATATAKAQTKTDTTAMADSAQAVIKIAKAHIDKREVDKALEYSIKAVGFANKTTNKKLIGNAYFGLAASYLMAKNIENGKKYFLKVYEIAKETNDNYLLYQSTNGLGYIYSRDKKDLKNSINYYKESIESLLKTNKATAICTTSINFSHLFLDNKMPDEALHYIELARTWQQKSKKRVPVLLMNIEHLQGRYYALKKDNQKALRYLNAAEIIAKEQNYYGDLTDILELKSSLFIEQKQYKKAIQSLKEKAEYVSLEFKKAQEIELEKVTAEFKVTEYKQQLEASEKAQKNLAKLTKSQNKTIIATGICTLLLLVAVILLIVFFKNKKQTYILESHNKILESEKQNVERLHDLKSKFISRVSHELRTPLHSVVGIISILENDKTLINKHLKLIEVLKFSGDYLLNLTNNVLRIKNIESEKTLLNNTNANLKLLLKNITHSYQLQSSLKNNKIHLSLDDTLYDFYKIDTTRLSEILFNLLENAVNFTENGHIYLSVSVQKNSKKELQHICFEVRDTGIGIEKRNQKAIFEEFNQVDENINTLKGAGLGLSIVKYLLDLMGSSIQVESTPGNGASFSFTLALEKGVYQELEPTQKKSIDSLKILVVEDDEFCQMVTGTIIKKSGYHYVIAENGADAIKKVQEQEFDLVLMDLNMPIMNGYDSSTEIKKIAPALLILALTAADISEIQDKCLKSGIKEVFAKPLNMNQFTEIINKHFG